MTKYKINNELNGIEVIFTERPATATLEALKNAGFRWHNVKKLWYAKQTESRLKLAQTIASQATEEAPKAPAKINLDNLGENTPNLYGSELAQAIRADLKRRGVDGVTVRQSRGGYTTNIILTIKATPADFVSVEEAKQRYTLAKFKIDLDRSLYTNGHYLSAADLENMTEEEQENAHAVYIRECIARLETVNHYYLERPRYWELTTGFFNKIKAAFLIANQWNYDRSDRMTDYYDVGYYLNIDIKKPENFKPREEMTEAERIAYAEEIEAERQEEAARMEQYLKEQEEREKAYKIAEEASRKRIETIRNGYTIEETAPVYFSNLAAGIGKEATAAELAESIAEKARRVDAVTKYKLTLTPEALEAFKLEFLTDFDFLAGKGGTATEDIRIQDADTIYKLNEKQRETVKFYNADCIALYTNNKLQFVIDPQGYNYARYIFIADEETTEASAAEVLKAQEEESKTKAPFYFPAPLAEQLENITPGEAVTIYKCDGWILNNIEAGSGTVKNIAPGNYAQYTGFYMTLTDGKKEKAVFLRDNSEILIYPGILPKLPEEVTSRRISSTMREMLNYNELFPATIAYYNAAGIAAKVDTIQR